MNSFLHLLEKVKQFIVDVFLLLESIIQPLFVNHFYFSIFYNIIFSLLD